MLIICSSLLFNTPRQQHSECLPVSIDRNICDNLGVLSLYCCSKVVKEGKSCSRLLAVQKIAKNSKSCSKAAEHNLLRSNIKSRNSTMGETVGASNVTYKAYLSRLKSNFQDRYNPVSKESRLVRFEDRLDKSELSREDIIKQASGKYYMQWRGVCLLKSPFDYCIYQLMFQEIKPLTIIETGTFNGGGALWMADLMKIHGVSTHVYTMDIDLSYVEPVVRDRKDITVIQGDSFKIEEAFPVEMLKNLPHPWLITEDAHTNLPGVLGHFHKFTQPGDYLVVEDTHPEINNRLGYGLFKELKYAPIGPTWTLDPFKEFMKKHGEHYRVDEGYTDLYGYNATWNFNSIICRV